MDRILIMSITLCKLNYVKLKKFVERMGAFTGHTHQFRLHAQHAGLPRPPQSSKSFCLTTDQEDRLNGPVGCLAVRNPIKRFLKRQSLFKIDMKNAKATSSKVSFKPLRHNLYKGKVPENKEGFYGIFYKFRVTLCITEAQRIPTPSQASFWRH